MGISGSLGTTLATVIDRMGGGGKRLRRVLLWEDHAFFLDQRAFT
jgi:hypothetical protein